MSDQTPTLKLILDKLSTIENRLDLIESSCSGMDNHIHWIQRVYHVVRRPLHYFIGEPTPEPSRNVLIKRLLSPRADEVLPDPNLRRSFPESQNEDNNGQNPFDPH